MASPISQTAKSGPRSIAELYQSVRARTLEIVAPLEIEDYVIQTAEFMSPPRWHIGHTSWFFETVLRKYQPGYKVFSDDFLFYFNSYYEGFGERIERQKRGTRSRPTVAETRKYRAHIDEQMSRFIEKLSARDDAAEIQSIIRLGLEHEMQHQELLVYDIKHLLCDQFDAPMKPAPPSLETVSGMAEVEGGLFELGYAISLPTSGEGRGGVATGQPLPQPLSEGGEGSQRNSKDFAWDNEKPAHKVFLEDFQIDRAPVSNGEYLEFINAGGYTDFRWWLSSGWEKVTTEQWQAPLYWEQLEGEWMIRDFGGLHRVADKSNEPVSHVSFLEASAYAKWAGKRLPTEAEWEKTATLDSTQPFPWGNQPSDESRGNLFENGLWSVAPIGAFPNGKTSQGIHQMIGDVWEWTTSDYTPYPGFKSEFDEYNDKWFVGQKVLRGGSFATPQIHIRSTYRNFFYPHERWMIAGFRCAKDPGK
ncbi:MAG TPA: ergothioneine biosynthesis protein EgtB [Pyrinomonadaceae bacterium]|nr:ergothioneine biosynthesis protein EgtB [Pyrinomonadaceae bacterium]